MWSSIVDRRRCPSLPCRAFLPVSDGEKGLAATPAPFLRTPVIGETVDDSAPLPVTIRGEDAGRQVRGGANAGAGEFKPEAIAVNTGINQMDGAIGLG